MDMLELLVQNGADLDAKNKNGETPFGNRCFFFLMLLLLISKIYIPVISTMVI